MSGVGTIKGLNIVVARLRGRRGKTEAIIMICVVARLRGRRGKTEAIIICDMCILKPPPPTATPTHVYNNSMYLNSTGILLHAGM